MSAVHHATREDDGESGDEQDQRTSLHGHSHNSTWDADLADEAPNDDAGSSAAPHASLFSPGVPAALPEEGSSRLIADGTRARVSGSSSLSTSSRPLAVLASASNMTRRTARLTVSDEQPIAQLSTQIPSAQKDVDDPTTPVDSQRSKETRGREYTTLTTLNRLFAGDTTMPASRTPSYNHATGPLYMRGTFARLPHLLIG